VKWIERCAKKNDPAGESLGALLIEEKLEKSFGERALNLPWHLLLDGCQGTGAL